MAIVEGPFQAIRSVPIGGVPDIIGTAHRTGELRTYDALSQVELQRRSIPGVRGFGRFVGLKRLVFSVAEMSDGGHNLIAIDPHTLRVKGFLGVPDGGGIFPISDNRLARFEADLVVTYQVSADGSCERVAGFGGFEISPVTIVDPDNPPSTKESATFFTVDPGNIIPDSTGNFWAYARVGDVVCPSDRCDYPEDPDDPDGPGYPTRAAHVIASVTPGGSTLGQLLVLGYDLEDIGGSGTQDLSLVFAGTYQPHYLTGGVIVRGSPGALVDQLLAGTSVPSMYEAMGEGVYTRVRRSLGNEPVYTIDTYGERPFSRDVFTGRTGLSGSRLLSVTGRLSPMSDGEDASQFRIIGGVRTSRIGPNRAAPFLSQDLYTAPGGSTFATWFGLDVSASFYPIAGSAPWRQPREIFDPDYEPPEGTL